MGRTTSKKYSEGFMDFENMLRQYFGDGAYGTQGLRTKISKVKNKLKKVAFRIEKEIIELETTTRHKDRMLNEVERLKQDLSIKETDPWALVIHSFSLVSRLLGHDYLKGYINTPVYYQTTAQFYSQIIFEGGDVMQEHYDQKNLLVLKKEIYSLLRDKGYSDFKISQVLNISEYAVKKLKLVNL
jgi:hypothetical protein